MRERERDFGQEYLKCSQCDERKIIKSVVRTVLRAGRYV